MQLKRRSFANPRTKDETRVRSEAHKKWVRGFACCIEGKAGHMCFGRIEAMHTRSGTDGCLGEKPGDDWTLPGCSDAHTEQHLIGEAAFERRYNIDMKAIAAELWRRSPARIKWEQQHGN